MKTWVRKSISVGVMAAGGLLVTQAAAQADVISTGNFGIGNGTQVVAPITTVADICGNSIAAGGSVAFAACDGGASIDGDGGVGDVVSAGNFGIGNGTQIVTPVTTVLDVCGNSVAAVAGVAFAACDGGASIGGHEGDDWDGGGGGYYSAMADQEKSHTKGQWSQAATNIVSSGNYGILNGTQIYAPVTTAINICGNSIPLIGSVAFASCDGGANIESARTEGTNLISAGNYGIGNGTQVFAPVTTVLDICGNSVAAGLSAAFASCDGGASIGGGHDESLVFTGDNYGILNGTQVYAPVTTVADVCGNSVAAVLSTAFASCDGGASIGGGGHDGDGHDGDGHDGDYESARQTEALPVIGNLGQLPFVAGLPVVGSLGQSAAPQTPAMNLGDRAATAGTEGKKYGGHDHWNGGGTNLISSGNFGIANGTQVFAPITTVADVSGNAIAALGSVAFAGSNGGASINN
jgi:hypothetical protein